MSYVRNAMGVDETLLYSARLHWVAYVKGALTVLVGVVLAYFLAKLNWIGSWAYLLVLPGLWFLITAFIRERTTDLVVTNRKIIAKVGLISRNTIEQRLTTLDNVGVDQDFFGRILGYGTIRVSGSGNTHTPIPAISSPMKFRRKVDEAAYNLSPRDEEADDAP